MGLNMKIKVLLVDDEKEFVETLAVRLRRRNFDIDVVLSGKEALEKIRCNSYDVVVLDVLMPGMDGIQVFSEIRRIDLTVQVIVLTGHAKVETAIVGMKAGILDYLIKPVRIEDLTAKIILAYKQKKVYDDRR